MQYHQFRSVHRHERQYFAMNLPTGVMFFANIAFFIDVSLEEPTPIIQPSCADQSEPDGSSTPFICKGEGPYRRCFCCHPIKHRRSVGWAWGSEAKNMTCACSQQRDRMTRNDVSIHCAENGNYDTLQCDNDLCWCVESISGKPTERIYPRSMMEFLPCYLEKPKELRQKYERQCESAALARLKVLKKLEDHGTIGSHIEMPICDYDGSYDYYKFNGKFINCIWKDGSRIGDYAPNAINILTTNCHCARDGKIFSEENKEFLMSCNTQNGNYEQSQVSNGMFYCVDNDGFATTQFSSAPIDCA